MFHGVVDVHADGEALVLWDGASRLRIEAGGALVRGEMAESTLGDGHRYAQVLLLIALVLALRWRGLFHLHAGALVAPDGREVLVAGHAGAGKSTLTLALMEAGCAYLGDDAVFFGTRPGDAAVLALPRQFHVTPRTAAAFPRLAPFLGDLLPGGDKRRLDPRRAWPGRERSAMALPRLLLLPYVAGTLGTSFEVLPTAEALGALIESSALVAVDGLPGVGAHLDALRRAANLARALRVGLGLDLLADPAGTARRLLQQA
jgi:hypothetical protein